MSLFFDNEKLFDAEGHLTDEGLYALKDGTLDDLGALEAAEHLSFCDYCLLRYTALVEAAPACLQTPMRDLIPQVQSLMRLRRFRIMTNRYVSAAAAVILAFMLWSFTGMHGAQNMTATNRTPGNPQESFGRKVSEVIDGFYQSLNDTFESFTPDGGGRPCTAEKQHDRRAYRRGGLIDEKERLSDLCFCLHPRRGADVLRLYAAGAFVYYGLLRVSLPGDAGGPAGRRHAHRLDVQLF